MRIEHVEIYKLDIPRRTPTRASIGVIREANNVVIRIISDEGIVGWGESSAFAPITGDSQETNLALAPKIARHLIGKDPLSINARELEIRKRFAGEPSIRSAFNMALCDIMGKAVGLPLYQLLGGTRRELKSDVTIGIQADAARTASMAQEYLDMGFEDFKLKVGGRDGSDFIHAKALRAAVGPDVKIRIDANQGWAYPYAVEMLRSMQDLDLQYVEQPLVAWNYAGLKELRQASPIPICADESVFHEFDAFKLCQMRAVDYLNIKLGKAGGISAGARIDTIAEASGCKCMIGCFAESRLGLSAAAHLAMAHPNIEFLDLDSAFKLADDPVIGGVKYDPTRAGLLSLPETCGIGAEIDPAFLKTCERVTV